MLRGISHWASFSAGDGYRLFGYFSLQFLVLNLMVPSLFHGQHNFLQIAVSR